MPPFSLIYKGGIFLYPIPSTETYRDSDKYLWYDGFKKEAMSYIDEDKNILVHESCVNLSQEEHSQYIPFEMERYYHGIDLMDMTLQIYFVNSQMGANISEPINVSYSEHRIRFGWLVDRNATAVSGTLMFEVRAIGTVEYEGTGNGKDLQYVWKTHPNSQITILKSLAGDTTFVPTEDWYHKLVATINKQTNDTITYKNDAADSASEANASEKAALASENEARKQATDSKNSANASETSAQRSEASAVRAESWAVGGTNSRSGEDQNNAKYWCLTTEEMLDTFKADIAADVKNLNDEITRAKAVEEELSNRIISEQDRATTVESTWSDRLNTEKTRAEGAESVLTTNLVSEVSRATNAENMLQSNITNEATRAQTAEEGLSSRITSEESRAKDAEAVLTTNLTSETSRATAIESALQSNINAEKTRAEMAENTLTVNLNTTNTALSTEINRAENAENELSSRVTATENTLTILIGADSDKSIRAIANEELAAQLVADGADVSMDSLQEIASWISNHPNDAAEMNNEIEANAANIGINAAAIAEIKDDIYAIESTLTTKANALDVAAEIADLESTVTTKANKVEVDAVLTTKADMSVLNNIVTNINSALDGKAAVSSVEVLSESVTALSSSLSNKANIADVNEALAIKADAVDVEAELDLKANKADVEESLTLKANQVDVDNTISGINTALSAKADTTTVNEALGLKANTEDVTNALAGKADSDHVHNYIHIGTDEPTDASAVLWIDPANGLKYYDGSAWVNVPMATS